MLLLNNKTIEKLKHDLVREGFVDIDGLNSAEHYAEQNNTDLISELMKMNLISEIQLLNFIESKLHIPYVELDDYTPDIECLNYITGEQARKYNIFPLFKIEDVLTIAMSDPLDLFSIHTLFENKSLLIEPVVASEASIESAINSYYFNKLPKKENKKWQDNLVTDNLNDETLRNTIFDIIHDAINNNIENIFMENSSTGLNLYFGKELKGYIPSILTQRFIYELKNIADINNDTISNNSRFELKHQNQIYTIFTSIFKTTFDEKITLSIAKPIKSINELNISQTEIDNIFAKPKLININTDNKENIYALAQYLAKNYSVLIVENHTLQRLNDVTQCEFNKNTAIYFDEILNQIETQNFDIIFWEKVYTEDQINKLRLLAHEITVATQIKCANNTYCKTIVIGN